MSWNYRIVKYADGSGCGLHEVHYDADGVEISMTEQPTSFVADTPEELRGVLLTARMDSNRRPVFDEPEDWE